MQRGEEGARERGKKLARGIELEGKSFGNELRFKEGQKDFCLCAFPGESSFIMEIASEEIY